MIEVRIKDSEPIEKALKRFKKRVDQARILRQVKERRYYTKATTKRRDAKLKAIYKQRMHARSLQ